MTLQARDKHQEKFIKKLQEIKESDDWLNLIITGTRGVGKTYIIQEIFKTYLVYRPYKVNEKVDDNTLKEKTMYQENYIKPYFITDNEFKTQLASHKMILKSPENQNADDNDYPLEMLRKSDLVIYDDYGNSSETSAYFHTMKNRVDYRLSKGLKTIFTTNLSRGELENKNKAIASRIQKNSIVLQLEGEDKRKYNQQVIKC